MCDLAGVRENTSQQMCVEGEVLIYEGLAQGHTYAQVNAALARGGHRQLHKNTLCKYSTSAEARQFKEDWLIQCKGEGYANLGQRLSLLNRRIANMDRRTAPLRRPDNTLSDVTDIDVEIRANASLVRMIFEMSRLVDHVGKEAENIPATELTLTTRALSQGQINDALESMLPAILSARNAVPEEEAPQP